MVKQSKNKKLSEQKTSKQMGLSFNFRQLLASYCAACGGALGTALYLNNKVKVRLVYVYKCSLVKSSYTLDHTTQVY